jgi:hypothetical protein
MKRQGDRTGGTVNGSYPAPPNRIGPQTRYSIKKLCSTCQPPRAASSDTEQNNAQVAPRAAISIGAVSVYAAWSVCRTVALSAPPLRDMESVDPMWRDLSPQHIAEQIFGEMTRQGNDEAVMVPMSEFAVMDG